MLKTETIKTQLLCPIFALSLYIVGSLAAHAQKHEQVTMKEQLPPVEDKVSVQAVKYDDVPVRAGEPFNFTFILDKAPTVSGGSIMYTIVGEKYNVQTSVLLIPGERECKGSFVIPAAAPGGTYTLTAIGMSDGISMHPFKATPRTFQVVANQNVVFPSSADIVVNASQQQLLRLEARHIQQRIEALKAAIAAYQQANEGSRINQILKTNIEDALSALNKTESDFEHLATGTDQSKITKVFFDDLRFNYHEIASDLSKPSARRHSNAHIIYVSKKKKSVSQDSYPVIAKAVLRTFEGNERAYDLVAESGLTFDLKVISDPDGASVSYHRRGDQPQPSPDPTTTTIQSLPYAVWYVRVEKPGYKPQEREHDAIRSTEHTVFIKLVP